MAVLKSSRDGGVDWSAQHSRDTACLVSLRTWVAREAPGRPGCGKVDGVSVDKSTALLQLLCDLGQAADPLWAFSLAGQGSRNLACPRPHLSSPCPPLHPGHW
jgi:hypothetical protein